MLSDRSYTRDDYPREKTSVLTWLLCALAAGYFVQLVFGSPLIARSWSHLNQLLLTIEGLKAGHIWTLATHSFLHTTHPFHVLWNLLALYFLGRELLPILGPRRFLGLYAGAILLGALAWSAVHWRLGGSLFGATAGVDALLIVFACFYPHQRMDFLFLFVFPISLKPKHLALGFAGVDLLGLLFYEIPGAALPFNMVIAHSAHLGGMLAGWIYFRYFHDVRWQPPTPSDDVELPRWVKRNPKPATPAAVHPISTSTRSDLRAEVDRILDKINSHGFAALTLEEKRLLDEAKDLLSRR